MSDFMVMSLLTNLPAISAQVSRAADTVLAEILQEKYRLTHVAVVFLIVHSSAVTMSQELSLIKYGYLDP